MTHRKQERHTCPPTKAAPASDGRTGAKQTNETVCQEGASGGRQGEEEQATAALGGREVEREQRRSEAEGGRAYTSVSVVGNTPRPCPNVTHPCG